VTISVAPETQAGWKRAIAAAQGRDSPTLLVQVTNEKFQVSLLGPDRKIRFQY